MTESAVVWHDVECGAYRADLGLWLALAAEHGAPVLDVGAGTGRVTLELARAGHDVTALDRDDRLLAELANRAAGLPVSTVVADARRFDLGRRFPLIVVPMQTIQLLGGAPARRRFLRCARAHLDRGGILAIALTEDFDLYPPGPDAPELEPDVLRLSDAVYSSRPIAVRDDGDAVVLERRRELITDGRRLISEDIVRLDRVSAGQLEREAGRCRLARVRHVLVPATPDHVGSVVVMLRG